MSDSREQGSGGPKPKQLELSLKQDAVRDPAPTSASLRAPRERPSLRLIQGEGRRTHEPLESRDAVVRVLLEAGADLLLRRISPERAQEIEESVDRVLGLFDRVDSAPTLMLKLRRELDELEKLVRETRQVRGRSTTTAR